MGHQPIAARAHTHTKTGNYSLSDQFTKHECFGTVGGNRSYGEKTRTRRTCKLHTGDSNPEPSCCESTVLITAAPCCPQMDLPSSNTINLVWIRAEQSSASLKRQGAVERKHRTHLLGQVQMNKPVHFSALYYVSTFKLTQNIRLTASAMPTINKGGCFKYSRN